MANAVYSAPYLGQVATRGRYPEAQFGASANQIKSRIAHRARDSMFNFQLRYDNFKGPNEDASGGALTLFSGIEYPLGSFTRVPFSGASSAAIASGSSVVSDPVPLFIPDGALFREWTFATWAGAQGLYSVSSNYVDLSQTAASGLTDNTTTGVTTGMGAGNFVYGASAIIGLTDKPSFFLIDDSRGSGNPLAYGTNDLGHIAGALGGAFAYINAACSGAAMWQFRVNSTAKLTGLAGYCSHVIIAGHINDLNGGDTGATCKSNAEGLITKFAGTKPAYVCTVEPYTTSSDSWATEANQTIWDATKNGHRNTYNDAIRAGTIIGAAGYFDIAAMVESVAKPGVWLAGDSATLNKGVYCDNIGLHGNRRAELAMMKAVNPGLFGSRAQA